MTSSLDTRLLTGVVAPAVCSAFFGACLGLFAVGLVGHWGGAVLVGLYASGLIDFYSRRVLASLAAASRRGEAEGAADALVVGIATSGALRACTVLADRGPCTRMSPTGARTSRQQRRAGR
ncbi:hypothetical protein [Streptomyces sp. NPDC047725]|uniref:hypothetical protein n=1 Tax=Streptomyces sp. NPDC047725 TaxID=3365487 RepID=UPI00370F98EA